MQTPEERRVAAARWAENYCTQFEEVLRGNWRDLMDRVGEGLDQLSLYRLAFGPDDSFGERVIEPAVRAWVERHVEPLILKATEEFRSAVQLEPDWRLGKPGCSALPVGSELSAMDALNALLIPGGVSIGLGAVTAGIVTTTKLLILSTVVVNWPLLIAGLALGTLLTWIGVYNTADIRSRLKARYANSLGDQLRNALLGDGVEHKGKFTPSLLTQLQQQVQGIATAARKRLAEGAG